MAKNWSRKVNTNTINWEKLFDRSGEHKYCHGILYYLWPADLSKTFLPWFFQYLSFLNIFFNRFCLNLSFLNIFFNRFCQYLCFFNIFSIDFAQWRSVGLTLHCLYCNSLTWNIDIFKIDVWYHLQKLITVEKVFGTHLQKCKTLNN